MLEQIEEGDDICDLGKSECAEYIFFIDRSFSMEDTIKLARQALITFL